MGRFSRQSSQARLREPLSSFPCSSAQACQTPRLANFQTALSPSQNSGNIIRQGRCFPSSLEGFYFHFPHQHHAINLFSSLLPSPASPLPPLTCQPLAPLWINFCVADTKVVCLTNEAALPGGNRKINTCYSGLSRNERASVHHQNHTAQPALSKMPCLPSSMPWASAEAQ